MKYGRQMRQAIAASFKQAANALAVGRHALTSVTVVDDDIDIHNYDAVDWAIAHRVNVGENDIVIMPATFGMGLDPLRGRA
jgi:4-hydroxy-3-polyprenylbenzoate decarboxylase